MTPLLQTDDMDRFTLGSKCFEPTMEKTEDGIVEIDRLCGNEELHPPTLALFALHGTLVWSKCFCAVHPLKQVEVFVGP